MMLVDNIMTQPQIITMSFRTAETIRIEWAVCEHQNNINIAK